MHLEHGADVDAGEDGERLGSNLVEPWQAKCDRDKGNPERGGDRDWAQ